VYPAPAFPPGPPPAAPPCCVTPLRHPAAPHRVAGTGLSNREPPAPRTVAGPAGLEEVATARLRAR